MKKAYKYWLKGFYPKMLHITCMAHGLHRVCEYTTTQLRNIDNLIGNVKNIYNKSPHRVIQFKLMALQSSLSPKPIITWWATGLKQFYIMLKI
jgi:hypothetical protein